jgi:hypothetical protein
MATESVKVWDGTTWVSLKGEPGPQEVSADAGNLTKLGSDAKVYTEVKTGDVQGLGTIATKAEGDYLAITGGKVRGPVAVEPRESTNGFPNAAILAVLSPDTLGQAQLIVNPGSGSTGSTTRLNLERAIGANKTRGKWTLATGGGAGDDLILGPIGLEATNSALRFVQGEAKSDSLVTVEWPARFVRDVVATSASGTEVSLLPTVSADAGNITKLGADGYLYTSVSTADVAGLGTIATKAEGDYLPITGGTVAGNVTVRATGQTICSVIASHDGSDGAAEIRATSSSARLQLRTAAGAGAGFRWQLVSGPDGDLTVGPINPLNNVSIRFTATDTADTSQARFGWPVGFERPAEFEKGASFGTPSANAAILDDYEEGTWIPFFMSPSGPIAAVYGARSGSYTKIGRMVFCTGYIELNADHESPPGILRIAGFPFRKQDGTSATGAVGFAFGFEGAAPTGLSDDPGTTNAARVYDVGEMMAEGSGPAYMEMLSLTAASVIQFSYTYFSDE